MVSAGGLVLKARLETVQETSTVKDADIGVMSG